jgi:hypothetical protein
MPATLLHSGQVDADVKQIADPGKQWSGATVTAGQQMPGH